jgi:hypothetical protein
MAAEQGDWLTAQRLALRVLRGVRPTLEVPWPSALPPAVWKLAYEGPPSSGTVVLDSARARLPSWELAWHGGASALARAGDCETARAVARELVRFGWTEEEIRELLAQRCPAR